MTMIYARGIEEACAEDCGGYWWVAGWATAFGEELLCCGVGVGRGVGRAGRKRRREIERHCMSISFIRPM
jgi:hypothetical protein